VKSLKTIVVTGIIAVAATALAFGGLHLGQSSADATAAASQPTKAKATYAVMLTAKQLAQLMHGQGNVATTGSTHHARQAKHQRQATHRASTYRSGNRCYGYGHSGSGWSNASSGSHSGGGCGEGCW